MFSVRYVIYDDDGNIFYSQELKQEGSSAILCRYDEEDIYPILSEITTFDIERFYSTEMDSLIQELLKLKRTLTKDFEVIYVNEIISLCQKCKERNKGQVVFNPFTDIIKIGSKEKN